MANAPKAERERGSGANKKLQITTRKRVISPRSPTQGTYLQSLLENELVFGVGPAGTGKTYLAVVVAVSMLLQKKVDRIILSQDWTGTQMGVHHSHSSAEASDHLPVWTCAELP